MKFDFVGSKDKFNFIFHNQGDAAKEYGSKGNYVADANIAGFRKIADAMLLQGVA